MAGGRLVIRVRNAEGRRAEGFVSVASLAEIVRRGGIVTRRLFAVITGNETPDDVAAILSWFHEDPHRLAPPDPETIRGSLPAAKHDDSERLISTAALGGNYAEAFAAAKAPDAAGHRNWSRFIDQILGAFREPRGPFGGAGTGRAGEDEEDDDANDRRDPGDKAGASIRLMPLSRSFSRSSPRMAARRAMA